MGRWCSSEPLFSSDGALRLALHMCDLAQSFGLEPECAGFHAWPEDVKQYSHLFGQTKYAAQDAARRAAGNGTAFLITSISGPAGVLVCQAMADTYDAVYDVIEGVTAREWGNCFPFLVMFLNQPGEDDVQAGLPCKHVWDVVGSDGVGERCSGIGYRVLAMLLMR